MGGKHKVANRTKNNARPSSSGRSAELLGASMPQFVGFSGIKEAVFPSLASTSTEELENSLDANFQLVLKKISKKDSTTKLKGLQEFAELVKNTEPDTVKALLPIWPRFYNILATDTDNKVREAAHNVHHQIVLKAKRNIAPYLKQVIAPWFTSQYDMYPPAASAAIQAFKDAFPVHKFQEAIVFCQEEILSYIKDNLLNQTPETLSLKQPSNAEEAEAKYERVITACLQGYYLYLDKVPTEKIELASALNVEIVSNAKFWKFAKHKVPPIRAAWFKVLIIVCQKAVFLLNGKETQATAAVFNNLDENEPLVLPFVWEAALLLMSSIVEWWKYVNVEKVYFPKLWKTLKQGGQGNANVIYPNLLPLLSHLPPMTDENAALFFNQFFENLRLSLKQKAILASRSESTAVTQTLVECLQYVVMKNQSNVHLCKSLIKSHLISTIEWCLIEESACHKVVFNIVSSLIQSWSRNSDFKVYADFFFENIKELFKITLYNLKEIQDFDCVSIANREIEFLQSLKHIHRPKKLGKVQFSREDSTNNSSIRRNSQVSLSTDEVYLKSINEIVFELGEECVKLIEEKRQKSLLDNLCSLINDFDKRSFFHNLSQKQKKTDPSSTLFDIYKNVLRNWLESSDLFCKEVVCLIFMLFEFLEEEDKVVILDDLLKVPSDDCLEWSISESLAYPHNKDTLVLNWLKSPKISNFFVTIAEKQINDTCSSSLSVIFKLALTENENGELYVQNEVISQIIVKLTHTLLNQDDQSLSLDTCASLAAFISTIIYTENMKLTYGDDLLLTLFKFSCKHTSETDYLSNETIYEVNSAWQDALTMLSTVLTKENILDITVKCASVIDAEFAQNHFKENFVDNLIELMVSYLRAMYKSVPLLISELLGIFFNRKWMDKKDDIRSLCQIAEYVQGNLSSPYQGVNLQSNVGELEILQYFVWSYVKLSALANEIEDNIQDFDDGDDEEEDTTEKDEVVAFINASDDVESFILSSLYDYTIGESFILNYNNTKYYQDCLKYNTLLEEKIKSIIKNLHPTNLTNIKSLLKEKSLNEAWFWCAATYNYYVKILINDKEMHNLSKIYENLTNNITQQSILGALHLTQVFKNSISYDNVHWKYGKLGTPVVLRSLVKSDDELDVQIAETFGVMEALRSENVPQFLYDNAGNISSEKVEQIIETIRACSALMSYKFTSLSRKHWDFGVLSLVSWASNCVKARALFTNCQFQAVLNSVTHLYIATDSQIANMVKNDEKNKYIDEWRDVLVESVHADLAQLWLYLAEQFADSSISTLTYLPFIQQFGKVTNHVNHKFLFKPMENYPKWNKFLKRSCSLLTNSCPALQLWGYKMILALIPGLIDIDTESVVNTNSAHRKGLVFEQFKEVLSQTNEIVTSMLMDFKLGEDTCRVAPSTGSYTYTFAYLLVWDVVLTLCDQSGIELKYQYADWLKNEELFKSFLSNLICLLPSEILHYSEGKSKSHYQYFLSRPFPADNTGNCYSHTCDSDNLEHYACYLFASSLMQLPALVRQWWSGLDSRGANMIERITSLYVTPYLIREELSDVTQHQTKFKNMTIKVIPTVREVLAVYTVDEATMELVITLPTNYPLRSPEVQCNRQIGGTTHKQWLLQLKKCILHQNGRIWDGLSLWNNNLDKKFDGVEECYICFAVLHAGTYQLPKLSCQTCKKKFHSACLYKWFATSNKSTCPICRNLF